MTGISVNKTYLLKILLLVLGCLCVSGCQPQDVPVKALNTPTAASEMLPAGHPAPQVVLQPSATPSRSAGTPAPTATNVAGFEGQDIRPRIDPTLQSTPTPQPSSTPQPAPTIDTRPNPHLWSEWPVVPTVSARAKVIFKRGLALGNDPRSFSVIGDCQSEPPVFMGIYDSKNYRLGDENKHLEETISYFKGVFTRQNMTVRDGMSVASVLSPLWADKKVCQPNETPLDCEFRLHKPVIVFINLGTNWKGGDGAGQDAYLRMIVESVIDHGAVPVLSTKADNLEKDYSINRGIVRAAYDFDVPLFNFWLSVHDLPGKGIDGTREGGYLTTEAWGRRNFVALQTLHAVWSELKPLVGGQKP